MSNLKELTAHAVVRAGGPIIAAKLLGVSTTEISYWCNQDHTRFIPIDHLVDLDAHADDLFLKTWAAKRGFDLVARVPDQRAAEVLDALAKFSKASGDLGFVALEAEADQHWTPNEIRNTREKIRPVKDSIEELERFLAH